MSYSPNLWHWFNQFNERQISNQKTFELLHQIFMDRIALQGSHIVGLEFVVKNLDIQEDNLKDSDSIDLIQGYRSLLISEIEQYKYLRDSLATDLIILIKNQQGSQAEEMKKIEKLCKQETSELKRNLQLLKQNTARYQQSLRDQQLGQKQNINMNKEEVLLNQKVLEECIKNYNKFLDSYFLSCANVQDQFQKIQQARRQTFQDIFMKIVVFNMSMVKNIEYVIKKLNDKVESYIPAKCIQFSDTMSNDSIRLSKFNPQNYIREIATKTDQIEPSLKLKQKQAVAEITNIWIKIKKYINKDEEIIGSQQLNQLPIIQQIIEQPSSINLNPLLLQKISEEFCQSEDKFKEFRVSIRQFEIPESIQQQVISFTQLMQNIQKLIMFVINYAYQNKYHDIIFKLYKEYLKKLNGFNFNSDIQIQIQLYKQNLLNSQFLKDIPFCADYIKLRINNQIFNQTLSKEEIKAFQVAEVKFIAFKLLQMEFKLHILNQVIDSIGTTSNFDKDDIQLLKVYLNSKLVAEQLISK